MSKASSMAGHSMTLSNLAAVAEGEEEEELMVEEAVQEGVVAHANLSCRAHAHSGKQGYMNIPVRKVPML